MSLVNKMLRDLDSRQASGSTSSTLPAAVSPIPDAPSTVGRRSAILGAAIALVALAAVFVWQLFPERQISSDPQVAPVVATQIAIPPASPSPAIVSADGTPPLRLDAEIPQWRPPVAPMSRKGSVEKTLPDKAVASPVQNREISRETIKAVEAWPQVVTALESGPTKSRLHEKSPADAMAATGAPSGTIDKQLKRTGPDQQAAAEYQLGLLAQRQGNAQEAATRYRMALAQTAGYAPARQALAGLLIDSHKLEEAEQVLRAGLDGADTAIVLTLARVLVERGDVPAALELLQQRSDQGARSAEYQGFAAALLNRQGRHDDAVARYQNAIQLAPNEARWWVGMGMALEAAGKSAEAIRAYKTGSGLPGLPPELAAHIAQRIK